MSLCVCVCVYRILIFYSGLHTSGRRFATKDIFIYGSELLRIHIYKKNAKAATVFCVCVHYKRKGPQHPLIKKTPSGEGSTDFSPPFYIFLILFFSPYYYFCSFIYSSSSSSSPTFVARSIVT